MANIPDPITRKEQYYSYMAGESSYLPEPITREEHYLYYLCINGIGGGDSGGGETGGTTNYNDLENKPQINGVTLTGNKTSADLSISAETTQVDHGTADTTFQLPPNQMHTWGEVPSLTLTLGAGTSGIVNEYLFAFISGATPTTLSLPESIQTDIYVDANTRYECSIVGDYMAFHDWPVEEAAT